MRERRRRRPGCFASSVSRQSARDLQRYAGEGRREPALARGRTRAAHSEAVHWGADRASHRPTAVWTLITITNHKSQIAHQIYAVLEHGRLAIPRASGRRRSKGTAVVRCADGCPRPGGRSRPTKRDARARVLVSPLFHAHLLGQRVAAVGTRLPVARGGHDRVRTAAGGRHRWSPESRATGVPAGSRRLIRSGPARPKV